MTAPKKIAKPKREHRQLAMLKLYLRSLDLPFEEEYRFHPERMWRFDLAIPSLKIAIEYQGHGQTGKAIGKGKHIGGHASVTGLAKDCEKDLHALLCGWRVLKFTALHFHPADRAKHHISPPIDAIRAMVECVNVEVRHGAKDADPN